MPKTPGTNLTTLRRLPYAYAFLFPTNPGDLPGPYDPRLRLAVDLYNRGIALGLSTKDGKEVDLGARPLPLSFGSLDLGVNPEGFSYRGNHLTKFVSLADLKVRGLPTPIAGLA